jgi:hypothetical protein
MASGAHVATTGMRRSCGGVAALADLGPGRRLGDTRLLEPDSAATAFPMRCLALLLIFGADVVRTGRRWWTALVGVCHGVIMKRPGRCLWAGRRWSAACRVS